MSEALQYVKRKGWSFTESGNELRMRCPFCHDLETSFSVNATTGAWHCFRGTCNERGRSLASLKRRLGDAPGIDAVARKAYTRPPVVKLEPLSDRAVEWFEKRSIPLKVVERCDVKQVGNELVFEFTEGSEVVNRQYRREPKGFRHEKNARPILWNMDHVPTESRELIITEGPIDAMTVMTWGVDHVVSVPSGAANYKWIDECFDWLERFDAYFLMTDEDEPGEVASLEISRRLPSCRRVRLDYKDANEALKDGMSAEDFLLRYSEAEWMETHLIRTAESYADSLNEPEPPGLPTGIDGVDDAYGDGIPESTVNVLAGGNGDGKSTRLSQVVLHNIESEIPVPTLISSNEMTVVETLRKMVRQSRRIPSASSYREFFERTTRGNLYLLDLVDVVDEQTLFESFELAARRFGVRLFVIDSITRIDMLDREDSNAREKSFMNRLVQFSKKYRAWIWLVSHIRKPDGQRKGTWFSKADIKGSGAITDLASNVFAFRRLNHEEAQKLGCDNTFAIQKNRKNGNQWLIKLRYDRKWERFEEVAGGG